MNTGSPLRRSWHRLAVISAFIALASCSDTDDLLTGVGDDSEPDVASVSITTSAPQIFIGSTLQLQVEIRDAGDNLLTGRLVKWSTSASEFATVDGSGTVSGVAPGVATITAKVEGISDQIDATIFTDVGSFAFVENSLLLTEGTAAQLTVTATDTAGNPIPTDDVVWTTHFGNLLTISSTGLVVTTRWSRNPVPVVASLRGLTDTALVQIKTSVATVVLSPDTLYTNQEVWNRPHLAMFDSLGNEMFDRDVRWRVANDTLVAARVTFDGKVYGDEDPEIDSTLLVATIDATIQVQMPVVLRWNEFTGLGSNGKCALTPEGAAHCWGPNGTGQLANDYANLYCDAPQQVICSELPIGARNLPALTQIAVNARHGCAVATDGSAYCWGSNLFGESARDVTNATTVAPAEVPGGLSFKNVEVGVSHSCGITTSDKAYCWGDNLNGALGTDGGDVCGVDSEGDDIDCAFGPVLVSTVLDFQSITTGDYFTCGLAIDGTGYCWGMNTLGQLGTGNLDTTLTPTAIAGGNLFTSISAGPTSACGTLMDGTTVCWGDNRDGQVGVAPAISPTCGAVALPCHSSPITVSGATSFESIDVGAKHTCGLSGSGQIECWGSGADGRLGNSSETDSSTPVEIAGDMTFTALSVGINSSCGLSSDGAVYCWGSNRLGSVGSVTITDCSSAVPCTTKPKPIAGQDV